MNTSGSAIGSGSNFLQARPRHAKQDRGRSESRSRSRGDRRSAASSGAKSKRDHSGDTADDPHADVRKRRREKIEDMKAKSRRRCRGESPLPQDELSIDEELDGEPLDEDDLGGGSLPQVGDGGSEDVSDGSDSQEQPKK
eukprot:3404454-Pyramimonas_sp.AAC.1